MSFISRTLVTPLATVAASAAVIAAVPTGAFGAVTSTTGNVHTRSATATRTATAIHVAPRGTGASCTATAPCSLDTGLARVRSQSTAMTANLTIVLHGGTYRRSQPIELGDADSGHNGHKISWVAARGQVPVIDGGLPVTGWSTWAGRAGVYRAKAPVGADSRQLYVNGVLADRTSAPAAEVLGTTAKTAGGFSTTRSIAGWSNLADTEVVWTGSAGGNVAWEAWTQRRCPLSSASTSSVTVSPECLALGQPTAIQGVGLPTEVENNLALLTKPGQFYLDRAAGYVYYMPRAGESMSTVSAVIPMSQGLVRGAGVHDLSVQGITFQHDNWRGASTPTGFIDTQAAWFKTPSSTLTTAPGAIRFMGSARVSLTNLTVRQGAGAGIEIAGGSSNVAVGGSRVSQMASSGIILGGIDPAQSGDRALTVRKTTVDHVGTGYRAAVGIFAGYVSDSNIVHNDIHDLPYTGISVGWGWGATSSMGNNHVDGNRVANVMQESRLEDGGAIYVNGVNAATSTIQENYLVGDPKPYGTIYLDGSASHWNVSRNVVSQTATNWVYVQDVSGQDALYNTVSGNWTDGTQAHYANSSTNTITNNQLGLTAWPADAQAVIAAAG